MKKILQKDPTKRATFDEILAHSWFEGYQKEEFSTVEDIF